MDIRIPAIIRFSVNDFLAWLNSSSGVIISLFPLCMIAYNIGGIMYVVYILVIVTVIHALESYVLNPKFMSQNKFTDFYTFMVLIFSEHFLGVWGLIIGIPIFIFLLDVLDVTSDEMEKDVGKIK